MADDFARDKVALSDPARNMAAVTPNDATDLPTVARALYLGTGGDIKVTPPTGGAAVTFLNHPPGYTRFGASRVWTTGTTAAQIIALW